MTPFQLLIRIVVILAVPVLIAISTYLYLQRAFFSPYDPRAIEKVAVEVAPGRSFSDVSREMADKRVIRHAWSLDLLAQFLKADTKIKAGEYEVSAALSPREILDKLMSGEVIKRIVMVTPGLSIKDLPTIVEQQGLMKADEFASALRDPGLLARAGISSLSFEGYLWPESYQFSRPLTAWDVIYRMMLEGEKHWPADFSARADELRMSRHEMLTLASIIEKETGSPEEMPVISSVFHNRLKQGMRLQADPTVIYGLENFNGDLTDEDMKNPHPYNTYVNFGLPQGPICNPGEGALRAALYPAETTYLYFVADGTGKHVFSTTYQEHKDAVERFQKRLAQAAK